MCGRNDVTGMIRFSASSVSCLLVCVWFELTSLVSVDIVRQVFDERLMIRILL